MTLGAPMRDGDLRIEPVREAHREPLRAACEQDQDIWDIYPICFLGEHFDRSFTEMFQRPGDVPFVLFDGDVMVGMSSFLGVDRRSRTLEIGRTYIIPAVRGTGLNRRIKTLMLDRAFAEGFVRVGFRVDTRNLRSMAAVRKLGATYEETLREDRRTWTGYVRDTAVFSIPARDWAELRG